MDDAEVEAVLFALGDGLEWTPYSGGLKVLDDMWKELIPVLKATRPAPHVTSYIAWHRDEKSIVEFALVPNGYYSIGARRKFWFVRTYTACYLFNGPHRRGQHPQAFKRRADAKAACERHYATGHWE